MPMTRVPAPVVRTLHDDGNESGNIIRSLWRATKQEEIGGCCVWDYCIEVLPTKNLAINPLFEMKSAMFSDMLILDTRDEST